MQFFFHEEKKISPDLAAGIARCCDGLTYISETDSPVTPFTGSRIDALDAENMRTITNSPADVRVAEADFKTFFVRLTKDEAWHDDNMREQTKKFLELQQLLEENLHDLKVFKIGEIRLTIYAVGLDQNNNVIGVSMNAVET